MYRSCIFCSSALGANEAIETFPVGRQVAFDAWKGRLWVVCPVCARWNLAPIEERWEAVEAAEKLYRDARLRVQSENVGLAQLPDGTRLVRVGEAVPGELAAWRYGTQLLRRRKRYLVTGAVSGGATLALYGGIAAAGFGLVGFMGLSSWLQSYQNRKVVYRLPHDDAGKKPVIVRRWHIAGINLDRRDDGDIELHIRDAHRKDPDWTGDVRRNSKDVVTVSGETARALLSRAMVRVNRKGATRDTLLDANRLLERVGSADEIIRRAAARGAALGKLAGRKPTVVKGTDALVLEMALNEESERRALEGELAALEAAWREAEEIAAIADTLPGGVIVNRIIDRLSG